jgi:hypothetical protein
MKNVEDDDKSEKLAKLIEEILDSKPGDTFIPPDYGIPDFEFQKDIFFQFPKTHTGNENEVKPLADE